MKFNATHRRAFLFITFFCLVWTAQNSRISASASRYPANGWTSATPESQGINSGGLCDLMEAITQNHYDIDSVIVVRNGFMVLEAYFHPYSKNRKHTIASCTKSIMSALIGIALDKGYIESVRQPVADFFKDGTSADADQRKQAMTLEHLLMMASGLDCKDSYLYNWKGLAEMRQSADWTRHVLALPMAETPGKTFEYCNGVSHLLSAIIQNTTGMTTLAFAKTHLFTPLGISDIGWDQSPEGVDIGWGEMRLRPRDMAKIGWLYLENGKWDQRQVLPADWVRQSTRGHIDATLFDRYGYHWWVDDAGFYMAVGYGGQFVFVVPDKNLVAVFTGDLAGPDFYIPRELLANHIVRSAVSSEPLPENPACEARLNHQVTRAALPPEAGFVWRSKAEGTAADGTFRRTTYPAFRFNYPLSSKKREIAAPAQIMRMKTPEELSFSASILEIPAHVALEDFGSEIFAPMLDAYGSNVEQIENERTTLPCGTPAFRSKFKWNWNGQIPLICLVMAAYKGDHCVFVATHARQFSGEMAQIVESLSFDQPTGAAIHPVVSESDPPRRLPGQNFSPASMSMKNTALR